MIKMLTVKLLKSNLTLSTVCVTCGTTYVIESVEGILFYGDRRIGNVCQECIKLGSLKLPTVLKEQSCNLMERAKVLEELSSYSIECPPWDEYLQALEDRNVESEKVSQEEKARPQMIMSRVFLIGEGIVPREEIEGLRSEHMRIFLTEEDISQWPSEILHLKKYTEIQIDDSYLFRYNNSGS
jgi:hypothetical protein